MKRLLVLVVPLLVGAGLLAGLGREMVLAYAFGASRDIEVFRVAFGLPSILSDSVAVSFVSLMIPVLVARGDFRPSQGFRSVIWASIAMVTLVTALGLLTMPLQARLLAPGFSAAEQDALVRIGRLCWVMFSLVLLSLPLRTAMSVRRRVWPGASAQLLRSGTFVAVLGSFLLVTGSVELRGAALAAIAGGAAVLAAHLLAFGRRNLRQLCRAIAAGPTATRTAPLLAGISMLFATQILISGGRILDRAVASTMPIGILAGLEYSYALLMAMAAVIGTSTNLVLAPRLGQTLQSDGRITGRYRFGIGAVAVLATLIGIVLALLAGPVVRLVYMNGAFDEAAAVATTAIFRIHAVALGPLVLALILTQILILSGGGRLLVVLAAGKLGIRALSLFVVLELDWGPAGIALCLGIAELAMALILIGALAVRGRHRKSTPRRW